MFRPPVKGDALIFVIVPKMKRFTLSHKEKFFGLYHFRKNFSEVVDKPKFFV